MFLPLIQRPFKRALDFSLSRAAGGDGFGPRNSRRQMIPGVLQPGLFGWDPGTIQKMSLYEYTARVLARFCETALQQAAAGGGKLVNYNQLSAAIWPGLLNYWNVWIFRLPNVRMLRLSHMDAKNPVLRLKLTAGPSASRFRRRFGGLAGRWLDRIYAQLESQRQTNRPGLRASKSSPP